VHFDLRMRVIGQLCGSAPSDTKRFFVNHAVLNIIQSYRQVVNSKTMCFGARMQPGPHCRVECPQCRIVQVAKKIPEKTDINLRSFRKSQLLLERVP